MTKRQQKATFADIVASAKAEPAPAAEYVSGPGLYADGTFLHRDGRAYELVAEDITPERARELGLAGASLAYDPCGCGGGCGWTWLGPDAVLAAAMASVPVIKENKRRRGSMSEWLSPDGLRLLVAADVVAWGRVL